MKIIQVLGLAALIAAFTAPASAGWSGYSVAQHFNAPPEPANSSTIAVSIHGRGVGQKTGASGKEIVEPIAHQNSSPRWR